MIPEAEDFSVGSRWMVLYNSSFPIVRVHNEKFLGKDDLDSEVIVLVGGLYD